MTMNFGLLTTYPPTQCGLATFSAALIRALTAPSVGVHVVAVVDSADEQLGPGVQARWVAGEPPRMAAQQLNRWDVAIIQHEFGIFPGRDGAEVLGVLAALSVPVITVLHTVPAAPSPNQRRIIEELAFYSDAVVTMTETARDRLLGQYGIDHHLITVIPHGADDLRGPGGASSRPTVLTWGLLGPGKGIEWAIEAMVEVGTRVPAARYLVLGETHPRVLERRGEQYRDGLIARVAQLGLSDRVEFDGRYLDLAELHAVVRSADVILLPYDSVDQVTSGVLIEAITAAKPVVSTAFPHAQELLSGGAGLVVERQNPAAIAAALCRVLTEPGLAAAMSAQSASLAPALLWPAVAERYRSLAAGLLPARRDRISA